MSLPVALLALLSLDTYNRGYDSQLSDTLEPADLNGLGGVESTLGSTTVIRENNLQEAQDAGFHAVAYESDGQTVKELPQKFT